MWGACQSFQGWLPLTGVPVNLAAMWEACQPLQSWLPFIGVPGFAWLAWCLCASETKKGHIELPLCHDKVGALKS